LLLFPHYEYEKANQYVPFHIHDIYINSNFKFDDDINNDELLKTGKAKNISKRPKKELPTIGIAQHPSSIGWMPVMTQLWMNLS